MATASKPIATATDEQLIRSIPVEFVRYHDARDIDKLVNLYTDDGRNMMPFHPIAQGKPALRQMFEMAFQQYDQKNLKVDTTHVEISGDIAFSLGTFKVNVKLPNGKRIDDQGKWLVTLRRHANAWKMSNHCFNSDLPVTMFCG